jgi:hypothetical protein
MPTTHTPRFVLTLLAVGAVLALGGCATLSESECRTADWGRLGRQDGASGYTESRLAEHAEACNKIGILPNATAWRAGWDQGVQSYCTPAVGWREGLAGRSYNGVCRTRGDEAGFLHAHQAGSEIHRLQNRIEQNSQELRRLEGQLRSSPNDEARRRLRDRMRDLDREQSHLRNQLGLMQLSAPRY